MLDFIFGFITFGFILMLLFLIYMYNHFFKPKKNTLFDCLKSTEDFYNDFFDTDFNKGDFDDEEN